MWPCLAKAANGSGDVEIEGDFFETDDRDKEDEDSSSETDEIASPPAPAVPDISFGGVGCAADAVAGKRPKKKGKKAVDDDADVLEAMSEADLLSELAEDLELKQIHKSLDKPYNCLSGLVVAKVIDNGLRVGHQLKGVTWLLGLSTFTCC